MVTYNELKFVYSTDFYRLNDKELADSCIHVICTRGEGSFMYNETCFHLQRNDIAVISHPDEVSNLEATPDLEIEFFSANYIFLRNILPSVNYSIGGSMSLYNNPIIPLTEENAVRFMDDIHRLRDRINDTDFQFYREIMMSLCLTLVYDIFEFHAVYGSDLKTTDRANYIVKEFLQLLSTGITQTHRDASYFADRLHVSLKYLSSAVKRTTGNTVMSYIDRVTIPMVIKYLDNENLSITQISDRMHFTSLSYFCRYCTKHLGMSPGEYRTWKSARVENAG